MMIKKQVKPKVSSIKKIKKIDKPLTRPTKEKQRKNIENQECKGQHNLRSYRKNFRSGPGRGPDFG